MKRIIEATVLIAIILCNCWLFSIAYSKEKPAPEKIYWQDLIAKPKQEWIETHGYDNDSILAYNVRRLWIVNMSYKAAIESLDEELVKLQKRVDLLEKILGKGDPNNVK